MSETWHPLAYRHHLGVPISRSRSWNAALGWSAAQHVWKPSEKTTSPRWHGSAVRARAERFKNRWRSAPTGCPPTGRRTANRSPRQQREGSRVSATGSTRWDAPSPRSSPSRFHAPFWNSGHNAAVVTPTADLDLTLRGVALRQWARRQRCTTLRRLFVHESL